MKRKRRINPDRKISIELGADSELKLKLRKIIVPPGERISLKKDYNPRYTAGFKNKEEAQQKVQENILELARLQDMLYAQDTYGLLIVLQALDAAGKDGAIKHVMSGINPQGCRVSPFKAPSAEELDHTFLWRAFKALPGRGMIGIFNRSYYEEVLVVRVHPELLEKQSLPPVPRGKQLWKQRYSQINGFEEYLVEQGIMIVKIFLNVSKEEQRQRFLERINRPEKNWKFSTADARERGYWNDYQKAYEDCFNNTSTPWAPWFIIPADRKWFARLTVSEILVRVLQRMDLHYPKVSKERKKELQKIKAMLEKEK